MTLPEAAQADHVEQLREALGPAARQPPQSGDAVQPAVKAAAGARALAGRAKRSVRRRLIAGVTRVVRGATNEERAKLASADARIQDIDARVRDLSATLAAVQSAPSSAEANRVNIELLKAEFRTLLGSVEELGMAFAPATGWGGAGARFAEMREQINALERRLREDRNVAARASTSAASSEATATKPVAASSEPRSELFSYVAFERRFRGEPEAVAATLVDRYADILAAHQPVVDLGCGRAELLEALAARGVDCFGVDTDSGMVADARARGLRIEHTDAISFLRTAEPGSLGAVFSAHVAEHLQLDDLISMIELARDKLKPGGVFIAETPNPASLIVLGNSFILDPTHVWPLHPSLFAFLCETAGFRDVRLALYSPASDYHLPTVDAGDGPPWAQELAQSVTAGFARLNDVLFGPQEYAVTARTAEAEPMSAR